MSTSSDSDNSDNAPPLSIAERIKLLQNHGFSKKLNINNTNSKTSKTNVDSAPKSTDFPQAPSTYNHPISNQQSSSSDLLITPDNSVSTQKKISKQQSSSPDLLINPDNSVSAQKKSPLLENFPISDRIEAYLLRDLLNETKNPPRILVLDIRLREEFEKGHIKTKNIVCLDPSLLKNEVSSVDIELNLKDCPEHEQKLFAERHTFDLVIYHGYDYDSDLIPGSIPYHKNSADNLVQAIFENEFEKPLKRYPVFLVGGFNAWERLTSEAGHVNNAQSNQVNTGIYDKTEMDKFIMQDGISKHDKEIFEKHSFRPITSQIHDPAKRTGKFGNINYDRTSIVLNTLDFYLQPNDPESQFMSANFRSASPDKLSNDLINNNPMPNLKMAAPNKPLPRPIPNFPDTGISSNSNDPPVTLSGSRLQRRKTIFDHPYHGFSEVKNPDYHSIKRPPPPKKPLPQIPYEKKPILPITVDPNSVQVGVNGPKYTHTSESSFSQLDSGIGTTGLRNLGNTCFMNSIIQCLSGTLPFARYFLDGSFKRHINRDNPLGTKGVLADKFATLIRVMWSDQYVSVSPVSFKEAIGCFAPQFSGSEQQDSQELLAYLLDGLHEDLNINSHNSIFNNSTFLNTDEIEDLPLHVASDLAWEKHLMRNSSIVVSLFQGQFCNRLMCMTCGKTSTTFDVFMYLSLPLPTNSKNKVPIDLETCLKSFIKEEILDGNDAWNCPRCNCPRRAVKQLSISRLPDILLIHLKRFSFYGPFRDKLETMVHFPIRRLDLTSYVLPNSASGDGGSRSNLQQIGPFVYDLYAISNHYGGLSGGHYTACVRNGYKNEWHKFDDSRASVCDERDIVTRAAYNLFYVRTTI
ncbi:8870_t:CDS:2 [Scutellospora calospora]|uniref:8870_t:CDS:1 n=1 Tax=Scutellospora calospora TaxID=85575 RepID=A0ACA9JXF0_9GLOM|nr:8870_t:CDS:2 [Scutellospora calospora]